MNQPQPYDYIAHYRQVAVQLREEGAKPNAPKAACERAATYIEGRLADPAVVRAFAAYAQAHTAEQETAERIKAARQMSFSAQPCAAGQAIRVQLDGAVSLQDAKGFFDLADGVYSILFPDQLIDKKTNVHGTPRTHTFTAISEAAALFEGWQLNKQRERG